MTDKVATFIVKVLTTEDAKEVYLHAAARMVAPSVAPPLDHNFIYNLIESNGYGKYQKDQQAIDELVAALQETVAQITSEEDAESVEFDTQSIAYAENAEISVSLTSDKMSANATIVPARGGKDVSLDEVKAVLEENGITYGISDDAIHTLIKESLTTESDHVEAEVAFGKAPINGDDAQFIPLVPTAMERILKPQLREDGTVDMHDLGDMPTVTVGTHLMRK